MSGSLGELVISLSADMAKFRNDMGQAQKVTNDTMQKISSDMDRGIAAVQGSFKMLASVAAGATAFLAGGAMFKDMVNTTNAVAGEVGKLSRQLGITAQQASVLRIALDDAFLSVEDMQAGANRITKQLLSNEDAFKRLGVATRDSNGHYRNTVDIMMEVNSALSKIKAGTDQNVAGMSIYGKSWGEVRGLMKLTKEAMDEAAERAKELHLLIGPEQVAASRQYKLAMKDLEDVNESLKVQIGKELIPVLTDLSVAFGKAGTSAAGFFAETLHDGVTKMGAFKSWLGRQADRIPQDKELFNWSEYQSRQNSEEQLYLYNMGRWAEKRGGLTTSINRAIAPASASKGSQIDGDAFKKGADAAKSAANEAERLRQEFNKGVQAYNQLVDTYNNGLPTLSDLDKSIAKIREEVEKLSKEHPEQATDAKAIGKRIEDQLRMAEARKVENAELRESIRLTEELNKDTVGFGSYGKGLSIDALKVPQMGGKLGKDGSVKGGLPKFSLTGAQQSGFSQEITDTDAHKKELLEIEKRYNSEVLSMKMGVAEQSLAILQRAAGEGSAIALTALVAQRALAVAQIIINTNAAASAATMAPPIGLGPVMGAPLAAEITAMGYANAALTGAVGVMDIAGKRAAGGPVRAGETYLVGEKGPELMTAAADGYVTPNHMLGGSIQITNYNDFRNADPGTEARLRAEMRASEQRTKSDILDSMRRGGQYSTAPRRG